MTVSKDEMNKIADHFHRHRAANRMIQQGQSVEAVNKYLRETPLEQVRQDNRQYYEQNQNQTR